MIITRTPFRISFFGGGTDYPAWYRAHGGSVLVTTIDKYCYISCRYLPPFFENRYRVVYSKIENCLSIDEIAHPAVREGLRHLGVARGVEIHHDGDLPARSGMGSSSSFMVGLLNTLHALNGQMAGKRQLALESIELEQNIIRENVGSQDQVAAAYGGFNHIIFQPNGEIHVQPVTVSAERLAELNSCLMLFYTGVKRTASDIASTYVCDIESKKRQLRIMKDLVDEGLSILTRGMSISAFGDLLHEAWLLKRSLSAAVTNPHVERVYEQAREAGALGGKLLGAGGGGFMLLFVPPCRQKEVKRALGNLINVPFKFEFSGSQIVFYDPEKPYDEEEAARASMSVASFREWSEIVGPAGAAVGSSVALCPQLPA